MKNRIILAVSILSAFCLLIMAAGDASAQQVKEKASTQKGWLGVAIQDITSQMEKAMDLKSKDGALVGEVTRKSPAEAAGIKEGDIIIEFNGKKVDDASDLQKAVADTKPESKVTAVVMRKGEKKSLDVVVGKQPSKSKIVTVAPRGTGNFNVFFGAQDYQGMTLRELNEQLGQYFGVAEGAGVLVWEVEKGSAADKAGVKAGDVISTVGKKKIKGMRDVGRALGIYDDGEKAELDVVRKGTHQTLTLEVQESEGNAGSHYYFDAPSMPKHRGGVFFNEGPMEFDMPDIHIESLEPDMDKLKIEMNHLKGRLKDQSLELREKIEREVRPRVRVRVLQGI
ncbi:MAG: PDZ domain-containing protein [Ignavibacteriales bacterium]|nr:PDZ domain-containing protein [Ignavibacteriales bacterium]